MNKDHLGNEELQSIVNKAPIGIRAALLLCLTVGASGCASVPGLLSERSWTGRPVAQALRKFGRPQTIQQDSNNNRVLFWAFDTSYQRTDYDGGGQTLVGIAPGGSGVASTPIMQNNPVTSRVVNISRKCTIQATIDSQNRITSLDLGGGFWPRDIGCRNMDVDPPG